MSDEEQFSPELIETARRLVYGPRLTRRQKVLKHTVGPIGSGFVGMAAASWVTGNKELAAVLIIVGLLFYVAAVLIRSKYYGR